MSIYMISTDYPNKLDVYPIWIYIIHVPDMIGPLSGMKKLMETSVGECTLLIITIQHMLLILRGNDYALV